MTFWIKSLPNLFKSLYIDWFKPFGIDWFDIKIKKNILIY